MPQTTTNAAEQRLGKMEDDLLVMASATDNTASNVFNKSHKPKLPPISAIASIVTRNGSSLGKTQQVGMTTDSDVASYQQMLDGADGPGGDRMAKSRADKRQIVLNVHSSRAKPTETIRVGRPRSKSQIRTQTQNLQHRSKKLAPLEVKF